jgi:F-type H+-transporting ATPase subunit b
MMRNILAAGLAIMASPALAAGDKPFFSLANTDFVVMIGFFVFIGILLYFKVPGLVAGMLDKRADTIRAELSEARALREEAQTLLASYERKQKEVQAQADRIVENARDEAVRAAAAAKEDIRASVARRLASAEEQIASAQAAAVREVKDRAVTVAVAAAQELIAAQMTATQGNRLIDEAIGVVEAKLH